MNSGQPAVPAVFVIKAFAHCDFGRRCVLGAVPTGSEIELTTNDAANVAVLRL